jgi:hypothetical protein
MAKKCQAKNPATCKNHGVPFTSTNPANDEAAKKDFFGENTWENMDAVQKQADEAIMRKVSKALRQSACDIEGFTGSVTKAGEQKVAEIVNDPELRGWVEQTEEDPSAAVKAVRQYFRDSHDNTTDGGPSALATVRLFKSLGRARELGEDIREEALLQAQKPAETASFEARAEGIVSLFRKHGILGTINSKEMDREQRSFIIEVEEQASGKHSKKPLEIMYRLSDMKVSVRAKMVDGEVLINQIQIIQYPYSSSSYDGDKFAEDLARIYNSDSYTKEPRTFKNN